MLETDANIWVRQICMVNRAAEKIPFGLMFNQILRTWTSTIYGFEQNRANGSLRRYAQTDSKYLWSQRPLSLYHVNCVGSSSPM